MWIDTPASLSKNSQAELRRLGVLGAKRSGSVALRKVSCWLEMIPLQREGEGLAPPARNPEDVSEGLCQPPHGAASDRDLPLSARREHIGKRCATRADPTALDHRIRERPAGPKYVLQTIWPDARCQPPKTDILGRPCLPRPGFLDCQMFVIGTSVSDLILPPPIGRYCDSARRLVLVRR